MSERQVRAAFWGLMALFCVYAVFKWYVTSLKP